MTDEHRYPFNTFLSPSIFSNAIIHLDENQIFSDLIFELEFQRANKMEMVNSIKVQERYKTKIHTSYSSQWQNYLFG